MIKPGRPAVKKIMVINDLRSRIVSGDMTPGSQVPTRRDLSDMYDATLNTVQQALETLERDGFVVSKVGQGTYVNTKPPHLNHFGLIFPSEPGEDRWVLYWDHLAAITRKVVKEQGLKFTIYTGISKHQPGEDYQKLLDDVRNDRLAGLIFSTNPYLVEGTDILEKPGIPRVVVGGLSETQFSQVSNIIFDSRSFVTKAVNFLKENQKKSVAIICQPGNDYSFLLSELSNAGIYCPYQFQQAVTLAESGWAKNCTRLLFDQGNANRPEALLILDDNLFDPALAGVFDAGLRIPQDLEIITHSNFPWQVNCPVPVTKLGYDMNELLKLAMSELESQREGNIPRKLKLSVVLEDELAESNQPAQRSFLL